MNWPFVSSFVLAGLMLGACGGSNAELRSQSISCGGEQRAQLDCSSEFKYDATNVLGGFSAFGLGSLEAKTEQKALREIDKETERFIAQARRLCDEYNKCVLDRETYAMRSENLRRRISRVPELYETLKQAGGDEAKRRALSLAYHELVPDETRTELTLSFSVLARRTDQADLAPIAEGARLSSGSRVAFAIQVTPSAHVYLFQKAPNGAVNVLFPDARISTKNPLGAKSTLRIPPGGASYKLDDKDIGTERVYIVASLEPIASLGKAVDGLGAGAPPSAPFTSLTQMGSSPDCKTRALSLEDDAPSPGCSRERGLSFDDDAPSGADKPSIVARTEAADTMIARVFSFEHVAAAER